MISAQRSVRDRKPVRGLSRPWLALPMLLLAACATRPNYVDGVPPEHAQADLEQDLPLLRVADELDIVAAWDVGEDGFLKLNIDGVTYFGRVTMDDLFDIDIHTDWLPIYRIEQIDEAVYDEGADSGVNLPVVDFVFWQEIQLAAIDAFTPQVPKQGVVLNLRDSSWFVYRDMQGELVIAQQWRDWPTDIPLTASIRAEEHPDALFAAMDAYLVRNGIDAQSVVFETGETGPYARPIAVIDRRSQNVSYLSLEPYTFGSMPSNYAVNVGKVGWQFVRSYYLELINRPVSYVFRLAFFVGDTVVDAGHGIGIEAFSYPRFERREIPPLNDGPVMDLAAWEAYLDKTYGAHQAMGTANILVDGDQYFPYFVDELVRAKESIKIRTYIFDRDDFAIRVADLLKWKSETVDVKVTMDGLGTLMAENKAAGTMPADYKAPSGISTYLRAGSNVKARVLTNPWLTGDHTKTSVIDGQVAFVGGMNIGREYRWEWHDLMIRLDGQIVDAIDWNFNNIWAHSSVFGDFVLAAYRFGRYVELSEPYGFPMRILRTTPARSEIYHAQIQAISRSQQYIFIENPYFASPMVLEELVRARLRGVDVRVILPMDGNHGIMNKSNVVAANTLLKYGARVFAYPGMSHVKAAIYDGWVCVGSANMDKMSLRVNRELNIASSDPGFAKEAREEIFEEDFAASIELIEPMPANWTNTFARILASQL